MSQGRIESKVVETQFGFYLRGQAVGRDQAGHTLSDIPISAYTSRSRAYQQFIGVQQNADVFFKLLNAVLTEKNDD